MDQDPSHSPLSGPKHAFLSDLSGLPRFQVTGPHATRFLHGILSQDINGLEEQHGALTCLLDAKSHVLGFFVIHRAEGGYYLTSFGGDAEELADRIMAFKVADQVHLQEPHQDSLWTLQGDDAETILKKAGFSDLPDALHRWNTVPFGGEVLHLSRERRSPAGGFDLRVPGSSSEALREALEEAGARLGVPLEARYWRMAAGIPTAEFEGGGEGPLMGEWGLPEAYSLNKGCYVGQEVVARQNTYGKSSRRIVLAEFSGKDTPDKGEKVLCEGTECGRVTSRALAPDGESGVVLLSLKSSAEGPLVTGSGLTLNPKARVGWS